MNFWDDPDFQIFLDDRIDSKVANGTQGAMKYDDVLAIVNARIAESLGDPTYTAGLENMMQGKINSALVDTTYVDSLKGIADGQINAWAQGPSAVALIKSTSRPKTYKTTQVIHATVSLVKDITTNGIAFYIGLGTLKVGDILVVDGMVQATNDNAYSVAWNTYLTLNDGSAPFAPAGKIGSYHGRNLLRDIHHDGLSMGTVFVVTQNMPNIYLYAIISAKPLVGSGTVTPPGVLNINYGELCATVIEK